MKPWRRRKGTRVIRVPRKSKRRQAAESAGNGLEAGAWYEAGSRSSRRSSGDGGGFWINFFDDLF
jgi:hypothetical protein